MIHIELFDTSLRDGSQKAEDYPTDMQAALMGASIAQLGIPHIEIGVPIAESQTQERLDLIIQAIQATGKTPTLYGFCRCVQIDIDASIHKMKHAEKKGVNIVVSGSELFQILRDSELKNKNWETLSEEEIAYMESKILKSITKNVEYACKYVDEVRICLEDGSLGKKDFLLKAIQKSFASGARVVSIPDTLGGMFPERVKELFEYLTAHTQGLQKQGLVLAIHAHNDRGLALANTFGALRGGARSVEGTLIGSGERVGNTKLIDVIGNISTANRGDIVEDTICICSGVDVSRLYKTSKIIYDLLGKIWNPHNSFAGEQSTSTQVGIHQSLENKRSASGESFLKKHGRITPYSLIDTKKLGTPENTVQMYTNLSGFSNISSCLGEYNITVYKNDDIVNKIILGLKDDLENTKRVYASRVYLQYLIELGEVEKISSDTIQITSEEIIITLIIRGETIILHEKMCKKSGILGTGLQAINNFLPENKQVELSEFSLTMNEGTSQIIQKYPSLQTVYQGLKQDTQYNEKMGIAHIEIIYDGNIFLSTAHDFHGETANIKALLYACIPFIYNALQKK